jgi:uncharacterized membrane protein YqiK
MKKKNEWLTPEKLFPALDGLLSEAGWVLGTFTAHAAAQELGLQPNATFYRLFNSWQDDRWAKVSSSGSATIAEVEAELRQNAQAFVDEMVNSWVAVLSNSVAVVNQAADQRVAVAERAKAAINEDRLEILDEWAKAEEERDAALKELADLRRQLEAKTNENVALRARLKERAELIKAIEAQNSSLTPVHAPEPLAAVEAARPPVGDGEGHATASQRSDKTMQGQSRVSYFNRDDRPSASEPDRPVGGQSELPLASNDPNPQEDR